MIDPFTAFAALKGATEAISQGIKTGKDLINMSSSVSRWAKAEASLQVVSSEKPKGLGKLFGKLTGAEQNAIDAHFRKEEANRIRDVNLKFILVRMQMRMLLKSVQEKLKTLVVRSEKIGRAVQRVWQKVKEWVSHKVKLLKVVVLLWKIDENELKLLSDKYKKQKGKRPEEV